MCSNDQDTRLPLFRGGISLVLCCANHKGLGVSIQVPSFRDCSAGKMNLLHFQQPRDWVASLFQLFLDFPSPELLQCSGCHSGGTGIASASLVCAGCFWVKLEQWKKLLHSKWFKICSNETFDYKLGCNHFVDEFLQQSELGYFGVCH